MALVQLTNALKLVIVEKVHVHSGTAAALATRPLHERGLGKHERSIGTLKQTVAVVKTIPLAAMTECGKRYSTRLSSSFGWPPRYRGRLVLLLLLLFESSFLLLLLSDCATIAQP